MSSDASDTDKNAARLQLSGNVFGWFGILVTTLVVCNPLIDMAGCKALFVKLGVPTLFALIGGSLLYFGETESSDLPITAGAITFILLLFAALALVERSERQDLRSGTLVLLGFKGWFLLQSLFNADAAGDNSPGSQAAFIFCWLAMISLAVVLDHETDAMPLPKSTVAVAAYRRSKILFGVFGVLVFIGCVLDFLSINIGPLVGASAAAATFEVCTIAIAYIFCAVWVKIRRQGIVLVLMGEALCLFVFSADQPPAFSRMTCI